MAARLAAMLRAIRAAQVGRLVAMVATRAMFRISVLGCLATLIPHTSANAAIVDCPYPPTPRERIICSARSLAAAQVKLDGLYAAGLTRLSKEGGKLLRDNQRDWLRFRAKACPVTTSADEQAKARTGYCLVGLYNGRIRDLEQVAVRVGPFLFSRVDRYSVTRLPLKASEYESGLAIHHVSYPRVDQPVTEVTSGWN